MNVYYIKAWLRGALKDAAESDAAAAKLHHNYNNKGEGTVQRTTRVSALTNNASLSSLDDSRDSYYFAWSTASSSTAYDK